MSKDPFPTLAEGDTVAYGRDNLPCRSWGSVVFVSPAERRLTLRTDAPPSVAPGETIILSSPSESRFAAEVLATTSTGLDLRFLWREKRSAFRINDDLAVLLRRLPAGSAHFTSRIVTGTIDSSLDDLISGERLSRGMAEILSGINAKLDAILTLLQLGAEGLLQAPRVPVSLSSSGMRLTLDEKCDVKDLVEIKLLLPQQPPVGILLCGRVVRIGRAASGGHETGLQFEALDTEVTSLLVQYTLDAERRMIRMLRGLDK